jgi:pimeloyl-ACP methyl ester carboxylesterase
MKNNKTHIYFVPGLAAGCNIFEYIKLPEETFQLHFLEWLLPISDDEPIEEYAKRMADLVTEENPVLIGVSFGGIMVQEMSKHLNCKKTVIISSVKSRNELPKRLKLIQKTKVYKLLPAKVITNIEDFSVYAFGDFAKKRVDLYKQYLYVRNEQYLQWAVYNVLHWNQVTPPKNIIHIHGKDDQVFPIKHIKNCITIEKGSHVMIINKAKTISKLLAELL